MPLPLLTHQELDHTTYRAGGGREGGGGRVGGREREEEGGGGRRREEGGGGGGGGGGGEGERRLKHFHLPTSSPLPFALLPAQSGHS